MLGGLLLVLEGALELRLAGLRQLRVGDLGVGHLLVGLVLAGFEVDLLGRGGLGRGPAAGIGAAFPGSSCCSGVTSLGTALDWSGGASVAVSMSLAEPSFPWVTIPLTSPLTSPAFPDSLYSSASSSDFGDLASMAVFTAAMNACLSKVPACWASIVSAFAALAWPATSSVGGSAAPCASFAFDAAVGWAFLAFAKPVTLPFTCLKAGSSPGVTPAGATGGSSSLSAVSGAGAIGAAAPPPPPPAPGALAAGGFAGPAGLGAFAPALPSGETGLVGLVGGTGFFGATAEGPKPVLVTASAVAGGLLASPSRSTGTPAALVAFSPFSTIGRSGSSPRTSRRALSMSATSSPDVLNLPAIRALTAELPANRCNANTAAAPPGRDGLWALRRPSTRRSPTGSAACSRATDISVHRVRPWEVRPAPLPLLLLAGRAE